MINDLVRFEINDFNFIFRALNEMSYRDAIENSSQYNNRLVIDRKTRLPFIDSQTGVAQSDCSLWMQKWERMPGMTVGQLYSYPSRKWKKKRRGYLLNDNFFLGRNRSNETNESNHNNHHGQENSVKAENSESGDKFYDYSKDSVYQDFDDGSDLLEMGDLDDLDSDYDDYEEYSSRKRKRKKDTPKRRRTEYSDAEKPFICEICDARYKTRPGLTYHYSHTHANEAGSRGLAGLEDEDYTPTKSYYHQSNSLHSSKSNTGLSNAHHFSSNSSSQPKNSQDNSASSPKGSSNENLESMHLIF